MTGIKIRLLSKEDIASILTLDQIIKITDVTTGMPIGILDGTWITHMRTGASTAIGAKFFARKNSKVITVVGGGAEGRTNLEAIARFFDFEEVRIVDIDKNVQADFAEKMAKKINAKVVPFDTVQDAVKESDIILLTTSARNPLMRSEWAKPGDYVTTISCFCDLDHNFVNVSDKLFMDDKECALERIRMMAGLEIPREKVYGDICEVMVGKKAKREDEKEIITYTPAGMGAVDVGVAFEAFTLARKKNLGKEISLVKKL